jgi:hypothetical protein
MILWAWLSLDCKDIGAELAGAVEESDTLSASSARFWSSNTMALDGTW